MCRIAPYQILLHDGRLIYAPQDSDQVIRLRPPPQPTDPPSPPFEMPADEDGKAFFFVLAAITILFSNCIVIQL